MAEFRGTSHDSDRPLTLREAARVLGLSYEWLRVEASRGRLKTEYVADVGRVVTPAELERFRSRPRRLGRPPKPKRAARPVTPRTIRGIDDLLDRVATWTGRQFSEDQRRYLVRFGALPARQEFPRGPRGRRAWLACQHRRLVGIAGCLDGRTADAGDLLIALKFRRYFIKHDLLTAAMLCYLWPLAAGLAAWREGEAEGFVAEAARRPSPYPGVSKMPPGQRADVYEAMLRIASGGPFTLSDIRLAVKGLDLPDGLLPERGDATQEPDLSWSGLFSVGQAATEKVVALVQASVTKREDGRYEFRPFCMAQEMDRAWTAARGSLDLVWQVISPPSVPTRVLMATIVRAVMDCLIIIREQGENAFLPIEQLKAAMRGLIGHHPAEVAEVLKDHPELSHLLDIAMGIGGRSDPSSGGGSA